MTKKEFVKELKDYFSDHEWKPYDEKRIMLLLNKFEEESKPVVLIKQEVEYPERVDSFPDMENEWLKICQIHNIDPVTSRKNKKQENVSARTYFVRYMYLKYNKVTSTAIGKFLGRDHSTVLHMRDFSKVPCEIAPLFQKKLILNRS
jgi:hypothetical protein